MNRPSTSSRQNPNVICVRSLVPNEKNSATSAISVGDERGPRRLDHRADEVVAARPRLGEHRVGFVAHPAVEQRELGLAHDQRDHDLDMRVAAGLLALDRGLHERPRPACGRGRA